MVSTGSGGGYLQGPALPRVFVFKMGNTLFYLQLLDVFNWKQYRKSTDVTIAVKRLPSKKPLPGLAFPTPGKEIHKNTIKSRMSSRKNRGDSYLLFPTIQEVGDVTVWKLLAAGLK